MTSELTDIIETLQYSPREPGRTNPDLLGWQTPAGTLLCAHCAGRILARGCRLPAGTRPIWQGSDFVGCTPCAVGS